MILETQKNPSIYLGANVEMSLCQQTLPPDGVRDFRQRCLSFYTEAATHMQKILSFRC